MAQDAGPERKVLASGTKSTEGDMTLGDEMMGMMEKAPST